MRASFSIDSENAKQLYDAIIAEKSFTSRSKVSLALEKERLVVEIQAKDFNALRAAATSYLRMLAAAQDTLEVIP